MSTVDSTAVAGRQGARCVPCLRLQIETLLVEERRGLGATECQTVALALTFAYDGIRRRTSARRDRHPGGAASPGVPRDHAAEAHARYVLESLGAIDLSCLEDAHVSPGSNADYVVSVDPDVHAFCAFSAYAVPQLRRLGWEVEVAPGFPYDVLPGDVPWYAHAVSAAPSGAGRSDTSAAQWLDLELGIEVNGRRLNLLPALIELIDRVPPGARIDAVVPAGRCFALPVDEGRYVAVPPERLRLLLSVLRELYDPGDEVGERLRFSQARAAALGRLDLAFTGGSPADGRSAGALHWSGDGRVRERAVGLAADLSLGEPALVAAPSGLCATLRPYQALGLRWLQHLQRHGASGVLADDMGLGKTLQTIAHLVAEKEAGRLDGPALVVAPTSLLHNWRRELARFAPSLRVMELYGPGRRKLWQVARLADVVLTTYTVLIRDEEHLSDRSFPILVLDEAQAIKNPRSRVHQAAASVQARQRICLTGTPLENNLGELWALFDLLVPGLLGEKEVFRRHYALPIEREGDRDRLQSLRAQVAPYLLRRMKEDVAPELPPKTEIVRPVELRGPQRDLYESLRIAAHADVRRLIMQKGLSASTVSILDALMKLRQVCCDPRLLRLGALSGAPGRALGVARTAGELADVGSAKADLFFELLGQQLERGRRVLVFSQFTSMLALLSEGLRARRIEHLILTGATADRRRPVEAFERRMADVFLISLKAGGTGLNLTSADTVIHYDPWWNPAAQAQATDRAHRIGQTKPVFVFRLIVAGSVEEQMMRLQERKRALADGVFGAAAGGGARWSAEEIDDLFAPLGSVGDTVGDSTDDSDRDSDHGSLAGDATPTTTGSIELGSAGPYTL